MLIHWPMSMNQDISIDRGRGMSISMTIPRQPVTARLMDILTVIPTGILTVMQPSLLPAIALRILNTLLILIAIPILITIGLRATAIKTVFPSIHRQGNQRIMIILSRYLTPMLRDGICLKLSG
jgi:hypothetical protein